MIRMTLWSYTNLTDVALVAHWSWTATHSGKPGGLSIVGFAENPSLSHAELPFLRRLLLEPPPEPAARPVGAVATAGLRPSQRETGRRFQGKLHRDQGALLHWRRRSAPEPKRGSRQKERHWPSSSGWPEGRGASPQWYGFPRGDSSANYESFPGSSWRSEKSVERRRSSASSILGRGGAG